MVVAEFKSLTLEGKDGRKIILGPGTLSVESIEMVRPVPTAPFQDKDEVPDKDYDVSEVRENDA